MKKLLWIFASALLLSNLFLSTGCGEDDPITPDLDPTIAVTAATETVVGTGQTVEFEVIGAKTTNDLQSLTILEDDVQVDDARISITGISLAANPQLITGSDVSGFTWTVTIDAHDSGASTYTFRLSDTKSNTAEDEVEINVETEITTTLTAKLLYNQGGGVGKGALDLDEGLSTGVQSSGQTTPDQAEIRDAGIDSTSTTAQAWRKQITYVNGTDLRYVGSSTPESTFDNISSTEAIQRIFDAATPVSNEAVTGDGSGTPTWGSYKVSKVIEEGDIFAASRNGKTYLFQVTNIVETNNNNEDYYELTIKY